MAFRQRSSSGDNKKMNDAAQIALLQNEITQLREQLESVQTVVAQQEGRLLQFERAMRQLECTQTYLHKQLQQSHNQNDGNEHEESLDSVPELSGRASGSGSWRWSRGRGRVSSGHDRRRHVRLCRSVDSVRSLADRPPTPYPSDDENEPTDQQRQDCYTKINRPATPYPSDSSDDEKDGPKPVDEGTAGLGQRQAIDLNQAFLSPAKPTCKKTGSVQKDAVAQGVSLEEWASPTTFVRANRSHSLAAKPKPKKNIGGGRTRRGNRRSDSSRA